MMNRSLPRFLRLSGVACSAVFVAQAGAAIIANPTITNVPSQFDGTFAASNLFDGTPVFNAATGNGNQWAGAGVGPHTIEFNFGSNQTFGWIAYAQRSGSNPALDKVNSITFTFSNAPDFSSSTTKTLTITNPANNNYYGYSLGGSYSAQYVRAVFTGSGGNPGGSEMRFYQPARASLPTPAILGSPSQFSASFAASFLFDGSGQAGLAANNEQWAGNGTGPHTLDFDFGSGVTMNAIGYAQRAGGNPAVDKVLSIAFYFSDTLGVFGGVPDENLTITDTTDNLFNEYNFAGAHAGRFVRAVFTGNGGNPGGSELRFYGVPEPTGSLLALAGVGAVMLRRRRA